jgi:hypothetical protein
VATAASDGNVAAIYGRFGIIARDDGVDVAMTILATGGNFASAGGLGVNAVRVALTFVGVALVTGDFFWGGVVGDAFDVGVAIDA